MPLTWGSPGPCDIATRDVMVWWESGMKVIFAATAFITGCYAEKTIQRMTLLLLVFSFLCVSCSSLSSHLVLSLWHSLSSATSNCW